MNDVIMVCAPHIKLNLWLADYHELLDFDGYKLYTITLSATDQKKFVKKVVRYIHEGKANISVEDLASINIIDYETSKLVEKLDNYHLDYSTSIILNVILELKKQLNLNSKKESSEAQKRIYDLILRQIKEPKDVLQIVDYFDNCKGRSSVSVKEEKDENGEIIGRVFEYQINEKHKPKFHPICDGRKAINKTTQEPILDDKTKAPFWWCANQKCFQPSREYHSSINWEKYTLIDFLKILSIDYNTQDLEIYLNIINKVNRFLKHMKCRECNQILYPKGKSQYAFYGVNNFLCKNESCSAKGADIYLTHCLNGYCEMEIDSRDSVKCKPAEVDSESCGWYVCNYCHACCNSDQLHRRKWVHENILHKEYTCHINGHRDLGILCCNKCGDIMESNKIDIIHYEEILNWFIEHKESKKQIHKFGQNALGKWWFVIKRGKYSFEEFRKKLSHYRQSGFQIPDIDTDKDLQLISEPLKLDVDNGKILTCVACGNTLDLSNDLQKTNAIKKFHKVKFAHEPF